jgi:hypothetical protein
MPFPVDVDPTEVEKLAKEKLSQNGWYVPHKSGSNLIQRELYLQHSLYLGIIHLEMPVFHGRTWRIDRHSTVTGLYLAQ